MTASMYSPGTGRRPILRRAVPLWLAPYPAQGFKPCNVGHRRLIHAANPSVFLHLLFQVCKCLTRARASNPIGCCRPIRRPRKSKLFRVVVELYRNHELAVRDTQSSIL